MDDVYDFSGLYLLIDKAPITKTSGMKTSLKDAFNFNKELTADNFYYVSNNDTSNGDVPEKDAITTYDICMEASNLFDLVPYDFNAGKAIRMSQAQREKRLIPYNLTTSGGMFLNSNSKDTHIVVDVDSVLVNNELIKLREEDFEELKQLTSFQLSNSGIHLLFDRTGVNINMKDTTNKRMVINNKTFKFDLRCRSTYIKNYHSGFRNKISALPNHIATSTFKQEVLNDNLGIRTSTKSGTNLIHSGIVKRHLGVEREDFKSIISGKHNFYSTLLKNIVERGLDVSIWYEIIDEVKQNYYDDGWTDISILEWQKQQVSEKLGAFTGGKHEWKIN